MKDDHIKIIHSAAKAVLKEEGLFQKGNSRTWIDDNGWYLTIVEFQPSGYMKGTYLNVAIHYLWREIDYFTFDYGSRIGDFKAFVGDAEQFQNEMTELAQIAIRQVQEYRRFSDLQYAKRQILNKKAANKTHELYDRLMICGLCEDAAARKYFSQLKEKLQNMDFAWEQEYCKELVERIEPIVDDAQALRSYIVSKILRQRNFWRSKSSMRQMREQITF